MVWQLLQVKHMREHPLILVGTMWNGLVDWARGTMVERGLASPPDLEIARIVATSEEAIPLIASSYEHFKQEKENANAGAGARGAQNR
jgi:predicted Rossmann-fold nucleotide-binding protein